MGKEAKTRLDITMDDNVSSVLLHRVNLEKNEARFYLLIVGSSLLDPHAVLRTWGRLGGHQRSMVSPCASAEEAQILAERLVRRRLRRGYCVVNPTPQVPDEEKSSQAAPRRGEV
jgi:predicted DNA-binding WGR domain protein